MYNVYYTRIAQNELNVTINKIKNKNTPDKEEITGELIKKHQPDYYQNA